ncbi:MAG TPA: cupin domain-containing protein [Acidimicrobiales bacterium]|nr:cupin domain-containing protein [Acidimicrobiales bacterium]
MEFERSDPSAGDVPEQYAPYFQGTARFQILESPFLDEGGPGAMFVHFDAGGRTRPHVHHRGQILHIVSGRGVVADAHQRRIVEPGDTVTVEPEEWHWHGGLADSAMSHLVVQYPGADVSFDVEERDWAQGYEDLA